MKTKIISLLAAVALMLPFAGCSAQESEYPVRLANVTFSSSPERAVVLSDSMADVMIASGYIKKIVGKSAECTQKELSDVPSVGKVGKTNIDKVKELNPDVIFTDSSAGKEEIASLRDTGAKIITLMPADSMESLSDLYSNVGAIFDGNVTGKTSGKKRAESISLMLDDLQRLIPESDVVVTACYLYDERGTALTADTFGGGLFDYANAVNVCKTSVSNEEQMNIMRLSNPQYIFCDTGVKDKIMNSEDFSSFKAVKDGNVFEIPSSCFERQGNSLLDSVSQIMEIIYPEISEGSKPEESSKSEEGSSKPEEDSSKPEENSKPDESSAEKPKVKADTSLKITDDMLLEKGQENDNVKKMQTRLKALGYFDEENTGYFGDVTYEAVVAYQKANGFEETGVADSKLLKNMFSAKAKMNPSNE